MRVIRTGIVALMLAAVSGGITPCAAVEHTVAEPADVVDRAPAKPSRADQLNQRELDALRPQAPAGILGPPLMLQCLPAIDRLN